MVSNLRKHATYMGSTVGFVHDQMKDDITILTSNPQVHDVLYFVGEILPFSSFYCFVLFVFKILIVCVLRKMLRHWNFKSRLTRQ